MTCPSFEMLSAFVDQELSPADAQAVQEHVSACDRCREELLDWIDGEERFATMDCVDPELLVAYSDGVLTGAERAAVTTHLAVCPHCRGEREAMNVFAEPEAVAAMVRAPWGERIAAVVSTLRQTLMRPGPVLSALTATALVIIALTQLLPKNEWAQLANAPEGPMSHELRVDRARRQATPPSMTILGNEAREQDAPHAASKSEGLSALPAKPQPAAPPAPAAAPAQRAEAKKDAADKPAELPAITAPAPAPEQLRRGLGDEPSTSWSRGMIAGGSADSATAAPQPLAPRDYRAEAVFQKQKYEGSETPELLVGYASPSDDSTIVARFGPGELQNRIENRHGWTLVELSERRRVWVRSTDLDAVWPPASPAPTPPG